MQLGDGKFIWLSRLLDFKLFGDYIFSRENKVQTFFFQDPLAKWVMLAWMYRLEVRIESKVIGSVGYTPKEYPI